jgi:hypothetical protein
MSQKLSILLIVLMVPFAQGFTQSFMKVSYGDDLFAVGGGARGLGMGGAQVALVNDVTAGFWNPAGLYGITNKQFAYMHSERFGGVVAYDYGAFAMPLRNSKDVIGITFFRQGVDGIKNTLNAWDRERDRPVVNPEDHITEFSTADMALMLSYATSLTPSLSWGTSLKLLYSRLGPFANGFGYSLDLGAMYRHEKFSAGVNLHNITTLMKLWSVNEDELEPLRDFFDDETLNDAFPQGQNEYTPPSMRIGIASWRDFGEFKLTGSLDLLTHFENRRTYNINLGPLSFQPHLGSEISYKNLLFLRVGLTDIYTDRDSKFYASPTLGGGFRVNKIFIDYGFSSFAGMSADLGYTHRISAKISL